MDVGKGHKGKGKGKLDDSEGRGSDGLILSNVPPEVNTLDALNRHFRHFGEVLKIISQVSEGKAYVQFASKASAEAAAQAPALGRPEIVVAWEQRPKGKGSAKGKSDGRPAEHRVLCTDPNERRKIEDIKVKREELASRKTALLANLTNQIKANMAKINDENISEAKRETLRSLLLGLKEKMDSLSGPSKQDATRTLMDHPRYEPSRDTRDVAGHEADGHEAANPSASWPVEAGADWGDAPQEADAAPATQEADAAHAPQEADAAPAPEEADAAPAPQEADAATAPQEADAAPAPEEADAAPAPQEADAAPAPEEADAAPAPQEADAAIAPQEADAALAPQEADAAPAPEEADAAPAPQEADAADAAPADIEAALAETTAATPESWGTGSGKSLTWKRHKKNCVGVRIGFYRGILVGVGNSWARHGSGGRRLGRSFSRNDPTFESDCWRLEIARLLDYRTSSQIMIAGWVPVPFRCEVLLSTMRETGNDDNPAKLLDQNRKNSVGAFIH